MMGLGHWSPAIGYDDWRVLSCDPIDYTDVGLVNVRTNPTLWKDTSTTPPTLRVHDGTDWILAPISEAPGEPFKPCWVVRIAAWLLRKPIPATLRRGL